MKLDRIKNTKKNIVFGAINKIVTLFFPFLIKTIIIKTIGIEYLGLNSLFASILQVLNLSELGFGSAIVFSMYKPIAEDDNEKICALLNFYKKVYRIIGVIILAIGLCLLPFLPKLIKGTYPDNINIYLLYLIYLLNTVLSYFLFAYKSSILSAFQKTNIISNINSIITGSLYIIQILMLYFTHNYYMYIIFMPVFTIINNIIVSITVDRLYPQYKCKGKLLKDEINVITQKVYGLMINKLCQISRNSFDSIFVSAYLGLTITAIYNNYYYILNAVVGILAMVISSMLAGVGNSVANESPEKNYNDLNKFNFIYMWLSGWCSICMMCLYQPFMELWVGKDMTFNFDIVILFVVYFYSLQMGVMRGLYSDAVGLWWENRYRAIAESIANILLNWIFVHLWGVRGVIVATLISILIINFGFGSQIVFKYYFKNGKLKKYFLDHFKYIMVTALICCISFWVCSLIEIEGILGIIIKLVICCILPNILYMTIYFKTKQYKISMEWFLSVFKLKNKLSFLIPSDDK